MNINKESIGKRRKSFFNHTHKIFPSALDYFSYREKYLFRFDNAKRRRDLIHDRKYRDV